MPKKMTQLFILSTKVSNTWKVLTQICEKREGELSGVTANAIREKSDLENDSVSSIFDRFHGNRGLQTLLETINFNYIEFEHLWKTCCQTFLRQKMTLGWGRKTYVAPTDLLFVILCILNTATNWDLMSEIFKKNGPTLQRLFFLCSWLLESPSLSRLSQPLFLKIVNCVIF